MKFLAFVLIIISSSVFAQNIRQTSFDDRTICEENKGVWREFSNGCVDSCEAKLDKFVMCTQSLTYSCDCGSGKCWEGKKCNKMSDYKKNFDKRQVKENAELKKKKDARWEESEDNAQIIVRSLVKKSLDKSAKSGVDAKSNKSIVPNNNLTEFFKAEDFAEKRPVVTNEVASTNSSPVVKGIVKNAKITQQEKDAATEAILNKSLEQDDIFAPPVYVQQEEAKKKEQALQLEQARALEQQPGVTKIEVQPASQ